MGKRKINHWQLILIIVLSGLVVWPVFVPGYFPHHDDLQVMRIFEMRKCLADFQIPCRWVPDMGYGNGFPLFNYYGVFPYYLGALASYLIGYLGAAKLLFFIPLVFGGLTMYFLAKEFFGSWGGITAAVLYLFAPYRAVDAYVRGAVSESFALALMPLLFYLSYKLIQERKTKYFISLSFSLAIFLTTHNIMTMLFLPILALWILYWVYKDKFQNIIIPGVSLALGFGMALFFVIPAFFEKKYVQVETLSRFDLDFHAHFVTLKQLFLDRSWGYGASRLGPLDDMSFQIGWPHWWLVIVALVIMAAFFLKFKMDKKDKNKLWMWSFFTLVFGFSIFMTHNKSTFVWEAIRLLKFVQFPWRFLSLSIFFASLLGGLVVCIADKKKQVFVASGIILLTILFNWSYFRPEAFYPLTDEEKLSGELWEQQQQSAILDYLPVGALEPREPAPEKPLIISGEGEIQDFVKKSNSWEFKINNPGEVKVEIPVFDFPGWQVIVDGQEFSHTNDNLLKRISVSLPEGEHSVKGVFKNTPVRKYSNWASLLSLIGGIGFIVYAKNKKILS